MGFLSFPVFVVFLSGLRLHGRAFKRQEARGGEAAGEGTVQLHHGGVGKPAEAPGKLRGHSDGSTSLLGSGHTWSLQI